MTSFLFVTHLTPAAKRSKLRSALNALYFRALKEQTWKEWKVLILGDEEKTEGRFHYVHLPDSGREEKFAAIKDIFSRPEIKKLFSEAKYTVKLDDDDLINPHILENAAGLDFDIYFDSFHTFIDSSSGVITQQQREWMASTCIHRSEHLLKEWNGPGSSSVGNLLYTDHSKSWHLYYSNKKKIAAEKEHPVYARILSPSSITSGAGSGSVPFNDISFEKYYDYLHAFGEWKKAATKDFDAYLPALADAWKEFSGKEQMPISSSGKKGNSNFFRRLFGT
ncbi:MAG: hypothetical protein HY064_12195 [Bacteroidetes bacterium]|nr:hypothetical protein [Bacteroidota bacterium]